MQLGRMIFYDTATGKKIVDTGQWKSASVKKTINQQIATYKALSERNRETFDYIELEYGQYHLDFAECNGYRVNPETKELEFSYPDPNESEEPQPYQAPLSVEVKQLKEEDLNNKQAIAELYIMSMGGY